MEHVKDAEDMVQNDRFFFFFNLIAAVFSLTECV